MIDKFLNKKVDEKQFYTGTVITVAPLTVKIFDGDDAISVVPTSNLAGLAVGDKLIFAKIGAQFFAIGKVQENIYNIGWIDYVRKSSDTAITNDNSLNNDPALLITLPANGVYHFESNLFVDSASVNPGFQWKYVLTDVTELSARAVHCAGKYDASNDFYSMDEICMAYMAFDSASYTIASAQYGYLAIIESGLLQTSTANGTVQLQWAQVTSHADSLTIKTDSWIKITKIDVA